MSDISMPQNPLEDKAKIKAKQDPKTRRINLIGQTKSIAKGAYKGMCGMIQSLTGDMVKIELQAMNRCISVPLDHLNIDPIERESYSSNLRSLLLTQSSARRP
jgi:transcription elongation factor